MSGTWRRVLMYVHDCEAGSTIYDHSGHVYSGIKGKKFVKRQDRRAARREQKLITRNAIIDDAYDQIMLDKEQRELDHELWLQEMELEAEDLWDHDEWEPDDDFLIYNDPYEDIYCDYIEDRY